MHNPECREFRATITGLAEHGKCPGRSRLAGTSQRVVLNPPRQKDTARLLVVLAFVLAALSYINTLSFTFVYDDLPQLVSNPRVHTWEHAPQLFAEQVWTQSMLQGTGNYYRPIFELWLLI